MPAESWLLRTIRARARSVGPRRKPVPRVRLTRRGDVTGPAQRHLIVCGDDPLAHRLVEELIGRYRVTITVILRSRRLNHGPQIARLPVRIVEAERLDREAFRQARLGAADALAIVYQDDVGNIDAALQAQELNPNLRLVIRMFNMSLGWRVRRLFPECRVLSDAQMAAPEFVSAALGEVAPVHVRLPGRTLYVARRDEVRADDVVCGLAGPAAGGRPDLLPADQERADLVLAVANGARIKALSEAENTPGDVDASQMLLVRDRAGARWWRTTWARRLRHAWRYPFGALPMLIGRKLVIAVLVLLTLLFVGTLILAASKGIGPLDAAYLTILDTLSGAQPDLKAGLLQKITETALTFVSIALIPLITAALVEAVVNARLAMALDRLRKPISGHVVVVGLGNVGTRVIRGLRDLGVPVVAVDKSETARGIPVARAHDIPYIIGDASREETLRAASVPTCRALVVVSTDDVTNLEAALQARSLNEDLRVVLRLFDGEFADRVQRAFGITSSRSVSFLAAPAFAAAMLEREVISTIPVDRMVLLLAEVPVCAGSALDGARLAAANKAGETRVIALTVDRGGTTVWSPPSQRRLEVDDLLVVVTTRAGLGRLVDRTSPPAPPAGPDGEEPGIR